MSESRCLVLDSFTEEQSDSDSEDYCEKCDHEYTIKPKGDITCLSCGEQVRDTVQFVPEEGYENRVNSTEEDWESTHCDYIYFQGSDI